MARLEVEITGSASGLVSALSSATGGLDQFSSAAERVSSDSLRTFSVLNNSHFTFGANAEAAANQAVRSFSLLNNAPFSFGVSAARAATVTQTALTGVNAAVEQTRRTFTLLNNTPFSFGTNFQRAVAVPIRTAVPGINQANMALTNTGRVLQDLPFGFIGIQNNLNPLLESFQRLRTESGSNMGALRALGGSLMGAGGIGLALSAVTAATTLGVMGWRAWTGSQKESKASTEDYIKTLSDLRRVSYESDAASTKEISTLKVLYDQTQNTTLSIKLRKEAVDELQRLYPDYFKNIKDEKILNGEAATSYSKLRSEILATARARAAQDLIDEKSKNLLKIRQERIDLTKQQIIADKEAQEAAKAARGSGQQGAGVGATLGAMNTQTELQKELNKKQEESKGINQEILNLYKFINKEVEKGGKISGSVGNSASGKELDRANKAAESAAEKAARLAAAQAERVKKALSDSNDSSDLVGLGQFDAQIEKIKQKYAEFYNVAKGNSDALKELRSNEANEIAGITVKREDYISSEVNRIRNESGIKGNISREKELAEIQIWYDAQVIKAQGNEEILSAIRDGRVARLSAVNQKYIDKETELYGKIAAIQDQTNAIAIGKEATETQRIAAEWEKRKKAANDYYNELRRLVNSDPTKSKEMKILETTVINGQQGKTNQSINAAVKIDIDEKQASKIGKDLTAGLNRATRQFSSNFYNTLTGLNRAADQSFAGIFSTLTTGLNEAMNDIFLNTFTQLLKTQLEKGVSEGTSGMGGKMSEQMQIAVAGAGLAGGIISGATKKTSYVGQGLGGALSGAATGAMMGSVIPGIGTAVGAVVGGLTGLIGGLFGAGKARKEEKRAAEALAEQQKQTALLERANALAYSSSIIGKMVDGLGMVSSVELNEFGQLTAVVSGQDLQFVLDRNAKNR